MVIKIVKIDKQTAIDESGCRYIIADDARGMNEKLWFNKENGEFLDSYLIKFSTRKPNTLNELNLYNEVVCSKICEKLGLYHVNYELCDFIDLFSGVDLCLIYHVRDDHLRKKLIKSIYKVFVFCFLSSGFLY